MLDAREAPQHEADRQKKEADDRRAAEEGAVDQQTHLSAVKGHDYMTTTNGTIKRVTDRGFGFITTEEGIE